MKKRNFNVTFLQREIWNSEKIYGNTFLNNVTFLNEIDGLVDPFIFRKALEKAVSLTEVFKVRFEERGGELLTCPHLLHH